MEGIASFSADIQFDMGANPMALKLLLESVELLGLGAGLTKTSELTGSTSESCFPSSL